MLKLQHLAWLAVLATGGWSAQVSRDAVFTKTLSFPARIGNGWIEAHWMEDGSRFWYVEGERGQWSFYEYDPTRKARIPLLDTLRVRSALSKITRQELPGTALPFNSITLARGERTVGFQFQDHHYVLQKESNEPRTLVSSCLI